METQLKSSRAKQKTNARGQSKLSGTERTFSDGPSTKSDHSRRLFVSSTNKRALARFAKGPTETTGFLYPRRRAVSSHEIHDELLPLMPLEAESLSSSAPLLQQSSPVSFETLEPIAGSQETNLPEHELENMDLEVREETSQTFCEEIVRAVCEETVPTLEVISKTESNAATKPKGDELSDDTVGPDDSQSSESESSEEESEVEIVKPISTPIPVVSKALKPITKSVPTPVVRKVVVPAALPAHRKVLPVASSTPPRSSWSKFLPLVIEIKATIPYPMHLLGVAMFLIVALILGLSYQFGADLGSDSDLQAQVFRLLKLALLFAAVAVCVNFVEDNKELPQKSVVPPTQPKLRGKANKNKKKMMKA